jgi:hypothetical protein
VRYIFVKSIKIGPLISHIFRITNHRSLFLLKTLIYIQIVIRWASIHRLSICIIDLPTTGKWVTILPILVRLSSCCLPFVSLFLHMCTNNCIHLDMDGLDMTTLWCFFFYLYWDLPWCRVSFLKGDLQFSNCLRIHLYRCVHIKVHWKMFHPFYPPPFSPLICPP